MNKISNVAFIALGANMFNPKDNFIAAIAEMKQQGIEVRAASSLWHSPAWPPDLGHPDYVNAVIKVATTQTSEILLDNLHKIEARLGRVRAERNAPRPLDLDILDYDGEIRTEKPVLPHPRALDRPFVLLPLMEIAPDWRHPVTQESAFDALLKLSSVDVLSHHVIERVWLK